ncbi:FixH family protein [Bacillus sp. EB600]|uniref:FixH family protein n=1 Tax=Bacillus sp. EB600 TaxID=2806345 RepID=UPI00210ACC17|nr:FixH family protein [Bacillus sp. EB600]MCQ6278506.1 FixH family protein [Bacillus sp. EB600]
MKSLTFFIVSMVLIFIAGCGSDQLTVDLITPKTYTPGQVSPIKVKVIDNKGNPVKGAKVSVEFNMEGMSMSNGNVSMTAKETGDGLYSGNANLQMEGDYTANIKVDKTGKKFEQEKRFSLVLNK